MPIVYGTSEHWMARARDARNMAELIEDSAAKQAMFEIAERYEHIAKRAEARAAGVSIPSYKSE